MKYTITSVAPSIDRNTQQQYKDGYGNLSWSTMATDENNQVYSFLKRTKQGNQPPKVGDVIEGTMSLETSKSGGTYWKFTSDRKDFGGYSDKSSKDPYTMLISYAKDLVVALIDRQPEKTKLTTENVMNDIDILAYHLKELYEKLKGDKTATITTTTPIQSTAVSANNDNEAPMPTSENEEVDINQIPF